MTLSDEELLAVAYGTATIRYSSRRARWARKWQCFTGHHRWNPILLDFEVSTSKEITNLTVMAKCIFCGRTT